MSSLGLPHAGGWLSVVPSPALGLRLGASGFVPVVGCRLGVPVCSAGGPCPACAAPGGRVGDRSLGCGTAGDGMARRSMLGDVLFGAAAGADLGPAGEGGHLLPGTSARPGDVAVRRWMGGGDGAVDVAVAGPLCPSSVDGAAAQAGTALERACGRGAREGAEACRREGVAFLPFALEALGGLHRGAVVRVGLMGTALAGCKGVDQGGATGRLFGRLSLILMRAGSLMLSTRCQDADFPSPTIDGIE